MHRARAVVRGVHRGTHPLEIANHVARDARMDVVSLRRELGPGLYTSNGLGEIIGRYRAQGLIHDGEMLTIKLAEFAVIRPMMFRAIPPIPIAAFRDEQFFEGQFALRLARPRCVSSIEVAGVVEIIPRAVVLGSADPHVEVGIDPGAGKQRGELAEVTMTGNRLGYRDRFDPRFALQSVIEAAKEFAARSRVIFPGIFAIQNDRYNGVSSLTDNRLRGLLDVVDEVVGSILRGHSRVNESDQI